MLSSVSCTFSFWHDVCLNAWVCKGLYLLYSSHESEWKVFDIKECLGVDIYNVYLGVYIVWLIKPLRGTFTDILEVTKYEFISFTRLLLLGTIRQL